MNKTDKSIRSVCIAAIKRSIIPPFDFVYTSMYEFNEAIITDGIIAEIQLLSEELIICTTIISDKIWTVLTTRRIISLEGVGMRQHSIENIKEWNFGDFKGHSGQKYTKGWLHFTDGETIAVFVETGRASMIMIYGVMSISKVRKQDKVDD